MATFVLQAEAAAAEQRVGDLQEAATAAADAAAFESGVLRRQVADLRQAADAERKVC